MDNQPLTHLTPSPSRFETLSATPKGEGSVVRGMRRRLEMKMELVRFAKFFLVEYLNSGKDVEAVVEEWMEGVTCDVSGST